MQLGLGCASTVTIKRVARRQNTVLRIGWVNAKNEDWGIGDGVIRGTEKIYVLDVGVLTGGLKRGWVKGDVN